jgi:hypothetical protein
MASLVQRPTGPPTAMEPTNGPPVPMNTGAATAARPGWFSSAERTNPSRAIVLSRRPRPSTSACEMYSPAASSRAACSCSAAGSQARMARPVQPRARGMRWPTWTARCSACLVLSAPVTVTAQLPSRTFRLAVSAVTEASDSSHGRARSVMSCPGSMAAASRMRRGPAW